MNGIEKTDASEDRKPTEFDTVAQLFETKRRWTRNHRAENRKGDVVSALDQSAVRWCLLGALLCVYWNRQHSTGMHPYYRAKSRLIAALEQDADYLMLQDIEAWNDEEGRTFADIQRIVRAANI